MFTRVAKRRDVVIALENSDNFFDAKLINHNTHGVCLLSTHPFQIGERIYIITENQPIDDFNEKFIEAYFANVIWCRISGDHYRIGAAIAKTDLLNTLISSEIPDVFKR